MKQRSFINAFSLPATLWALLACHANGITTNFFANFASISSGVSFTNTAIINSGTAVGTWSFAGLPGANTGVGALGVDGLGNRVACFGNNGNPGAVIAGMPQQLATNYVVSAATFPCTNTMAAGTGTRVTANFATPGQFTGSSQSLISFNWGIFGNGNPVQKYNYCRGLDASGNEVFNLLLVAGSVASSTCQIFVRGAGETNSILTAVSAGSPVDVFNNNLTAVITSGALPNSAVVATPPANLFVVQVLLTNNQAFFTFSQNGTTTIPVSPVTVGPYNINSSATTISKLEFSSVWNFTANTQNKGFWIGNVQAMDGVPAVIPPHQYLWTGASSAVWNIAGAANWSDLTTGVNPTTYFESATNVNGLQAIFDDSSAVNTVNLAANVQPTLVTFSNSTAAYVLSGTGVGGSAQIQKYNAGTLALTGVNTNTGGVAANGGSVIVSSDASLGGPSARLTLGGGTVEFTANLATTRPILTTGNSTLLVDSGVTLQLGGLLSSGPQSASKDGPGTLVITNGGNFRLHTVGGTTILDGKASITNNSLGFASIGLGVATNAAMYVRSNAQIWVIGSDLNVGDNLGSTGLFYIQDNAFISARNLLVGKFNPNTVGLVFQTGGVFTNANAGSPGVLIGGMDATGASAYGAWTISGGRADILGNFQIGAFGTGEMFISGGAVNVYGGFPSVGRNIGGIGNLVITGGQFNDVSPNNTIIGEQGTGTLTVSGTGVVNLNTTPLRIGGNGAANVGVGTVNLNSGGQIITTGVLGTTGGSATFNFNGGILRATNSGSPFMTLLTSVNVLAGGAVIDDGGGTLSIEQDLTGGGGGGLTKLGAGTLTLNGLNNSFTGATVVSNGALNIRLPSLSGSASLSPGAKLGVIAGSVSSAAWTLPNLSLPSANTLNFGFVPDSAAPLGALMSVGVLNVIGNHTVNVTGIGWPVGTTVLLDYGSLTGGGTFTFGPLPIGVSGYLTNNPSDTAIELVVTYSVSQRGWYGFNAQDGSGRGLWDIGSSLNWTAVGGAAGGVAYQDNGTVGDYAVFDSSTGPNPNVAITTTVHPLAVLVTNTSDFTFYGPGKISGAGALTKDSSGNLFLNETNDYAGGTFLRQGSITLNTNNALPMAGVLSLGSPGQGANLVLNGFNQTLSGIVSGGSGGGLRRIYNGSATPVVLDLNVPAGVTNVFVHTLGIAGDTANANNFALVKDGAGQQQIATSEYQGTTTINNGALLFTGAAIDLTNTVTVNSGGIIGGNGSLGAPVVLNSGASLSPGNNGVGTLVLSNSLTMASGATSLFEINNAAGTADLVSNLTSVVYAGNLVATNVSATPFSGSKVVQLFSVTGAKSGNFSSVTILPATGATGTFNPTTGQLTINTVPTTPTNLTFSVSGGVVSLSWPSSYRGWSLQVQTNSLNVGLGTNWVTVPGSSLVTSTNFPVLPSNPTVFYRLSYLP